MIANIQKFTNISSLIINIETPCREKKVGSEKQRKRVLKELFRKHRIFATVFY